MNFRTDADKLMTLHLSLGNPPSSPVTMCHTFKIVIHGLLKGTAPRVTETSSYFDVNQPIKWLKDTKKLEMTSNNSHDKKFLLYQ